MRFVSCKLFRRGIGRRYLCALLLGAYVLTAVGIPLPLPGGPVKIGDAFPCAMNRCGCDSAERCWRSCCCHTLAERIAWARRNGVRPPAFAIAQARAARIELALFAEVCDAAQQTANCCAADRLTKKPACCAERQAVPRTEESNRSGKDDHIIGWRAMACRGHSMHWLAAVPTLVVPPSEPLNDLLLVSRIGPAGSEVAAGVPDAPDVPPPKLAKLA
jgi:hypothetical protein